MLDKGSITVYEYEMAWEEYMKEHEIDTQPLEKSKQRI
jgi:hypothetical protein